MSIEIKFLKRDTMLGILVIVSLLVFTLLAIGGVIFSYTRKLGYSESPITNKPSKDSSNSTVIIERGDLKRVEGFIDTIMIILGGPDFQFQSDEAEWKIGIFRKGRPIISLAIGIEDKVFPNYKDGYILNPEHWNRDGQNILICYQKPSGKWDIYLNGFLIKSDMLSENNLVPSEVWYDSNVPPDFATVTFT